MVFNWLNAGDAAKRGVALADQFAAQLGASASQPAALQEVLQRADEQVRGLNLNFYKKAKFANSFKWRLLESGVNKAVADEVTQKLVVHLSHAEPSAAVDPAEKEAPADRSPPRNVKHLLALGDRSMANGAYAEAVSFYEPLLRLDPRHGTALNNIGTAFFKLGRYEDAETCFTKAIKLKPGSPDGYSNLGIAQLMKGDYRTAETLLRRALKLNPRFIEARINLGLSLSSSNRLRDANSQFEKALKHEPRNADALFGMALNARTEGDFDDARRLLDRALSINPTMPRALAALASLRKMTPSDDAWRDKAEEVAQSEIAPLEKSELLFALGKYYDDVDDFKRAFDTYKRGNELLKTVAAPYDPAAYTSFVDAIINTYTADRIRHIGDGGSLSEIPVFVVGMPRSGTSLTDQIISSHPSAKGVGELPFWSRAVHDTGAGTKGDLLDPATRGKLAEEYLALLKDQAPGALRVVDKAPINSDYLGIIHSVFPKARILYMQRDPIDTCLSCYFQKFVLSMNFTTDLSNLRHYYQQHMRLMAHWRSVLPAGTLLDVPYAALVGDQEGWSRKILSFLNLEWTDRVLEFYDTKRPVGTASFWQVRQKIYGNSIGRWRNYEKFIGPLSDLKRLPR